MIPNKLVFFSLLSFAFFLYAPGGNAQLAPKDTMTLFTQHYEEHWADNGNYAFYDTLLQKGKKSRLAKRFLELIIRKESAAKIDTALTIDEEAEFMKFEGTTIHSIRFIKLDLFGQTVYDTTMTEKNWLEKLAEKAHVKTRDFALRENLLFRIGDRIKAVQLVNNERILRQLPFLQDARIVLEPVSEAADRTEVIILIQDKFPFGLRTSLRSSRWFVTLRDINMFGLGHELEGSVFVNNKNGKVGFEGNYQVTNILGTFINSDLKYVNSRENMQYEAILSEPILSPETKYSGEMRYNNQKVIANPYPYIPIVGDTSYHFSEAEFWAAHTFNLGDKQKMINPLQLSVSLGIYQQKYQEQPFELQRDQYYAFHNKNRWLARFYLSQNNYLKSGLIYEYGTTEDIPYGKGIGLTLGTETSEFNTRLFTGADYSQAYFSDIIGYNHFRFGLQGYWHKSSLEQGLFFAEYNWFSKFKPVNHFGFRHFLTLRYKLGIKRYDQEAIGLTSSSRYNSFGNKMTYGNQRLNASWETVAFSPWEFAGFRLAFFGYADGGFLLPREKNEVFKSNYYAGFGFGIRIGNTRLVFQNIELRLAYYPLVPEGENPFFFKSSGSASENIPGFTHIKPDVTPFR
ncbi:MAG: hypothetical protein MI784_05865 [Cytophagales bacterium]|nr:hypothetical protein [Cytophagales bacterium]